MGLVRSLCIRSSATFVTNRDIEVTLVIADQPAPADHPSECSLDHCQRRSKTRPAWRSKSGPLTTWRHGPRPGPDRGLAGAAHGLSGGYSGRLSPVSGAALLER